MTMDKLFDGSDAHLLGANAELIQRLRTYAAHHNSALLTESADILEAADKRIAELEAINGLQAQSIGILAKELDEAERKLAVAREAMEDLCDWDGDLVLKDFCEGVLAQIGEDS